MEQFHNTSYGKNILIDDNGTKATRTKDCFFGTVFGAQPLKPFQPVSVEVTSEADEWDGRLRYGFININPQKIKLNSNNPYYMTELLNTGQVRVRKLPYEVSKVGHTLSYYYTPTRKIFVSFNGTPSVVTSSGDWRGKVDFCKPVWPILDLYAGTKAIKIVQGIYAFPSVLLFFIPVMIFMIFSNMIAVKT